MNEQDYEEIGNSLLEDCKNHFLDSKYFDESKLDSDQYGGLYVQGNITIQFREWQKKPFYLIVFSGSKYLYEVELIKIQKERGKYTWYLSTPKNEKTTKILEKMLGNKAEVGDKYKNMVLSTKENLDAGTVVYKEGYLIANNDIWENLSEKFIDIIDAVIIENAKTSTNAESDKELDFDGMESIEGYRSDQSYLKTKRNRTIVAQRKKLDNFTCQVCGFKLEIHNKHIIECHHKITFEEEDTRITNVDDLVCLCPTCHRIIHTKKPPYEVDKLKIILGINS